MLTLLPAYVHNMKIPYPINKFSFYMRFTLLVDIIKL